MPESIRSIRGQERALLLLVGDATTIPVPVGELRL